MAKKEKLSKAEIAKQQKMLQQQEKERKQQMLSPFEIHVMPQRFIGAEVSKKQSRKKFPWKIVLIVVLVLVFLASIVFGAYQLYKTLNQPINNNAVNNVEKVNTPKKEESVQKTTETTNTQETTPTTPENTVTEPNNTQATETTPQENNNTTNTENTNQADNTTTPENVKTETTQLSFSVDTDNDGLTDEEEDLYGTELRKPDTDGDGFTDGQELLNLYSPFSAGPVPLETVATITKMENPNANYNILYPSGWLPLASDQSKLEYSFTSLTGEVMYLKVLDNPDELSLSEWLIVNQPNVNPNTISDYTTKKGLKGVKTANGLVYYINVPKQSKVYKFIYDAGNVKRLNFMTTFQMMVNSLTIL